MTAIVLCTLFLVALPGIGIATAQEDDYVLDIYGNANEDDTIDMRDLTYVKLIFFGKKPETELSDAKYDGKINPLDFVQIKLIIVGKEKQLTIVDSADRIVTVKKPVERIVVSYAGTFETLRSLGLEKERIAGVTEYVLKRKIFFSEFSDYPSVGKYPIDVEMVLSLNPDAVFLYARWEKEERQQLEDAGISVCCFECSMPKIYVEEVKKIGYIIDKEEEAGEFLEYYKECVETIKERVEEIPEDKRVRVYFEYMKYKTGGKGTGYHQRIEAAGGKNIFDDCTGYFEVDPEEVINRNPEVIITSPHGGVQSGYEVDDPTGLKNLRDEIISRPELASVAGVKDERVYVISGDIFGGAAMFIGSAYFAKWFYPELFDDMDPQAIHQEYLTEFQGLDYDLDEHGVFVYPPLE